MHTLLTDNRKYIGITCRKPSYRWNKGKGYIPNTYFWNAIQKYGWDSFKHEILFENLTRESACNKESALIKLFNTTDPKFGFNLTSGGDCPKVSEATRIRCSNAHKGKYYKEINLNELNYCYYTLKWSTSKCAQYFGVSRWLITSRLCKDTNTLKKTINITQTELEEQYLILNKTLEQCASYFGCSKSTITRLVKKCQLKKDSIQITELLRESQQIYNISYDELYTQYISLNKTRKECAIYFNCGTHIIDSRLKYYNIRKKNS